MPAENRQIPGALLYNLGRYLKFKMVRHTGRPFPQCFMWLPGNFCKANDKKLPGILLIPAIIYTCKKSRRIISGIFCEIDYRKLLI